MTEKVELKAEVMEEVVRMAQEWEAEEATQSISALYMSYRGRDWKPSEKASHDTNILRQAAADLLKDMPRMTAVLTIGRGQEVLAFLSIALEGAYWAGYRCAMRELFERSSTSGVVN